MLLIYHEQRIAWTDCRCNRGRERFYLSLVYIRVLTFGRRQACVGVGMGVCMCACACACVCACVCACACVRVRACVRACVCACVRARVCVRAAGRAEPGTGSRRQLVPSRYEAQSESEKRLREAIRQAAQQGNGARIWKAGLDGV